ncbi:JmjC domain-containing protein [Streptomyces sp. NPDC127106]|uniref:JmjC domain-containing protein n=1 Tax=Streptomyces sp. NPDC127106 TaxID=3345360 RepID=UPI0036385354
MTAPALHDPAPSDLLPRGLALADFLAGSWGKEIVHGRSDSKAVGLLDVPALEEVLRYNVLRFPYVFMSKDRARLPVEKYCSNRRVFSYQQEGYLDGEKAVAALAGGASLYLNHLEDWHPAFGRYLDSWHPLPVAKVVANAFVTPAGTQAVGRHWDDSHNFILQTAGSKRWRIYAPPAAPHPDMTAEDLKTELLLDTVLEPGDVIYFPPAFPHEAEGSDGLSVHLTFAAYEIMPTLVLQSLVPALDTVQSWKRLDPHLLDPRARAEQSMSLIREAMEAIGPDPVVEAWGGRRKQVSLASLTGDFSATSSQGPAGGTRG